MGTWFSSQPRLSLEEYCHQQPGWFKNVVEIDSVDKWNELLKVIIDDNIYNQGRAEVLYQFFSDVLFNLCECRGDRETATQICMAYDSWLYTHPRYMPKHYRPALHMSPLFR